MKIIFAISILLFFSCSSEVKERITPIEFLDHSLETDLENNFELKWITTTDTMFVEVYHSSDPENFSSENLIQKNKLGAAVIFSDLKGRFIHLVIPEHDTLVVQLQ